MLHLPMEAVSAHIEAEAMTITTAMNDATIAANVGKAVKSLSGITGVNNHEGSKATADKRVMKAVVKVLKEEGLFFVDSRTSNRSVAYDIAKACGVITAENQLFLDNDPAVEAVVHKLRQAGASSLQGSDVVIGHARLNTAAAIREFVKEFTGKGLKIVFVAQLVN